MRELRILETVYHNCFFVQEKVTDYHWESLSVDGKWGCDFATSLSTGMGHCYYPQAYKTIQDAHMAAEIFIKGDSEKSEGIKIHPIGIQSW